MGQVIIHTDADNDARIRERNHLFRGLSTEQKIARLFSLIKLSVAMNGGRPLKKPQGKGLIINKKPTQ